MFGIYLFFHLATRHYSHLWNYFHLSWIQYNRMKREGEPQILQCLCLLKNELTFHTRPKGILLCLFVNSGVRKVEHQASKCRQSLHIPSHTCTTLPPLWYSLELWCALLRSRFELLYMECDCSNAAAPSRVCSNSGRTRKRIIVSTRTRLRQALLGVRALQPEPEGWKGWGLGDGKKFRSCFRKRKTGSGIGRARRE